MDNQQIITKSVKYDDWNPWVSWERQIVIFDLLQTLSMGL